MSKIPDNNLPICLQQYDVNILNTDQLRPCNDKSCVSSERGCCPDNVTSVSPSGTCPIGGCAETIYGCCPYSTESKIDSKGSNCGTIVGSVLFSTVTLNPSNLPTKRVWNINLSGYLKPNVHKYYITFDFHKVDWGGDKRKVTFEDFPIGTFNICGRVLNATKYTKFTFCSKTETVTIIIDTSKWDFRLKREAPFSFNINLNDSTPMCAISSGSPTNKPLICYNGIDCDYITLANKESCTIMGTGNIRGVTVWNNNGELNYGTYQNQNDGYFWLYESGSWWYIRDATHKERSIGEDGCVEICLGNKCNGIDTLNHSTIQFRKTTLANNNIEIENNCDYLSQIEGGCPW